MTSRSFRILTIGTSTYPKLGLLADFFCLFPVLYCHWLPEGWVFICKSRHTTCWIRKSERKMGQTKPQTNFVSGFQQTLAMIHQVQGHGTCWRHMSERLGFVLTTFSSWSRRSPMSSRILSNSPESPIIPKRWSGRKTD
jgi:hypothetical protein